MATERFVSYFNRSGFLIPSKYSVEHKLFGSEIMQNDIVETKFVYAQMLFHSN